MHEQKDARAETERKWLIEPLARMMIKRHGHDGAILELERIIAHSEKVIAQVRAAQEISMTERICQNSAPNSILPSVIGKLRARLLHHRMQTGRKRSGLIGKMKTR
jgi:hypothetical protein